MSFCFFQFLSHVECSSDPLRTRDGDDSGTNRTCRIKVSELLKADYLVVHGLQAAMQESPVVGCPLSLQADTERDSAWWQPVVVQH